jgi:hypothetical protein
MKWIPVLEALIAGKTPIALGLLTVDNPPRGVIQGSPFEGIYEIETAVHVTDPATGDVVHSASTTLLFHCDDIGWISRIPRQFIETLNQKTQPAGALSPEDLELLGLDRCVK